MRRLQSVQNAATRLVTSMRHCDHITPTLRQLHWLPVRQRVLFKLAVLVFRRLTDQAASYLADDCLLVSDVRPRRLRLSDSVTCVVRRTRNTYGDRCFAAAVPRVWNSLPAELRQCDSLGQFKRRLKTYLFGIWDHGALWLLSSAAPYRNTLTQERPGDKHSGKIYRRCESAGVVFAGWPVIEVGGKVSSPSAPAGVRGSKSK